MQDKPQKEHTPGAPWKVVKKTSTYDAAVAYRDEILESWTKEKMTDMHIKIKRMNDPVGFTVRTRLDPKVVEERKKNKNSKGKKKNKGKSSSRDKSSKSA